MSAFKNFKHLFFVVAMNACLWFSLEETWWRGTFSEPGTTAFQATTRTGKYTLSYQCVRFSTVRPLIFLNYLSHCSHPSHDSSSQWHFGRRGSVPLNNCSGSGSCYFRPCGSGAGSVPLTNRSGSGSRSPNYTKGSTTLVRAKKFKTD